MRWQRRVVLRLASSSQLFTGASFKRAAGSGGGHPPIKIRMAIRNLCKSPSCSYCGAGTWGMGAWGVVGAKGFVEITVELW